MTHSVSLVLLSAISVPTVGMATPMRISAGRIVSPISSAGLPCVCSGIAWPRSRKRHDDEADGGEHDQTDDAGDDEHRILQVLDLLGVRPGRLPRVLRGVVGAAGGGDGEQRDERETAPSCGRSARSGHGVDGSR